MKYLQGTSIKHQIAPLLHHQAVHQGLFVLNDQGCNIFDLQLFWKYYSLAKLANFYNQCVMIKLTEFVDLLFQVILGS